MYRILNSDPAPLAALVPDLDPEVARIVERAMRKEADQRYQSLDDMREDLATVRRRLEGSDAVPAPDVDALTGRRTARALAEGDSPLTPMPVRHSRARALAGVARDSTPVVREELASSAPTLGSRAGERAEATRSGCPSRFEATRDRGRDRGRMTGWSCPLRVLRYVSSNGRLSQ